jgi:hypothetical protein
MKKLVVLIHNIFLQLIKNKMGMASSTNTNIITCYGLVNAHLLFHKLQVSQATDFMIRLNDHY